VTRLLDDAECDYRTATNRLQGKNEKSVEMQ
jgi:hypothetical protein